MLLGAHTPEVNLDGLDDVDSADASAVVLEFDVHDVMGTECCLACAFLTYTQLLFVLPSP